MSEPTLTKHEVAEVAASLYRAEQTGEWIQPVSAQFPEATIADAYAISQAVTDLKVSFGRVIKGHKVGLTSKAMRSLTNATEPDYGTIFDNWFVYESETVNRSAMNRPLVEVELAFVLRHGVTGPGATVADLIRAVDFVLPSIEIVDSRQLGRGPNMLVDSISDAASCGLVVLGGRPMRLDQLDVRRIGATLSINGDIMESGQAAAVMGNPLSSACWLINKLSEFGVAPEAGHVILSGSFIKAIPFEAGDSVSAMFDTLGDVTFRAV